MKKLLGSILAAFLFLVTINPTIAGWTLEQRQFQLMQDINTGQKSKELTDKDAKKLRKMLANIARKKSRIKKKGTGKLTEDDTQALSSDLDDVRTAITKLKADQHCDNKKSDKQSVLKSEKKSDKKSK